MRELTDKLGDVSADGLISLHPNRSIFSWMLFVSTRTGAPMSNLPITGFDLFFTLPFRDFRLSMRLKNVWRALRNFSLALLLNADGLIGSSTEPAFELSESLTWSEAFCWKAGDC